MQATKKCSTHNQTLVEVGNYLKCPARRCKTVLLKRDIKKYDEILLGVPGPGKRNELEEAKYLLRECLDELLREDIEKRIREFLKL